MSREPRAWPELAREKLQDCRVFSVHRSATRSPQTGREHDFFRIEADDWVNVVATTPADELVMVRQYRHGSREVTLEIPGGIVDPGEKPAEAAARELLEETGYAGEPPERIGVVNPNPALFGNRVHTYLVRGATWRREIRNEGTEETVVERLPLADVHGALREGRIDHALVMCALYWFDLGRGAAL